MVQAALYQLALEQQGRRIRAPRRRVAHRLRQPRGRSRRGPPHADPARLALRPPRDPRRRRGLAGLGGGQRNRPGSAVHSSSSSRRSCTNSTLSRRRRLSRARGRGNSPATSCTAATASTPRSSARCSGAPSERPRRSSSPPSSRSGVSPPQRSQRAVINDPENGHPGVNGGAKRDHLGGVRRDRLAAAGLSP